MILQMMILINESDDEWYNVYNSLFGFFIHRIGMIFQFLYVHAHFIFYHWVRHNLILQKNKSYYLNCTSNTSTRWHFTRVVIIFHKRCLWCLWWWWWSSLALGCQAGQRGRCEACCWNADPCSWHKIKVIIIILIIIITFLIVIFIVTVVTLFIIRILHRGGYTPLMLAGQQGKIEVYNLLLTTYR